MTSFLCINIYIYVFKHNQSYAANISFLFCCFFFFVVVVVVVLGSHPRHMEAPGPGIEPSPQQ